MVHDIKVSDKPLLGTWISISHPVMPPEELVLNVLNAKYEKFGVARSSTEYPSEKVNEFGVTTSMLRLSPSGAVRVMLTSMESLVV
jgi:hypothetical protein